MSRKLEMKWGLIFVFTQLIWMIGEKLLGFHDDKIELHPIVSNFFMIPAILVYVLALKKKRNLDYGGSITYKQSFISGLVISLVVTLLAPLTQYVTSTIITPDYFGNVIAYSVEKKLMNLNEAQNYFNLKNYVIQSTLMTPVLGLVTTAIVSIFVSRKKFNN